MVCIVIRKERKRVEVGAKARAGNRMSVRLCFYGSASKFSKQLLVAIKHFAEIFMEHIWSSQALLEIKLRVRLIKSTLNATFILF